MNTFVIPIVATLIGVIVLVVATIWQKKNKVISKSSKNKNDVVLNVHEFINIRDIIGNFLYSNDNKVFTYFKVNPITIDLYSQREKRQLCQMLTSQMASEQKPFKFLAVSRPVDIRPLITSYSDVVKTADKKVTKDILKNEMQVMMNYANSGDVVQRQFYFMLWENWKPGGEPEIDLTKRINDFKNKFASCRIDGEILNQQEIVRLCNLINNPSFSHIEGMDFDPNITEIVGLYDENNEGGDIAYA